MEFFDGWKTLNARFDEGDLTAPAQLVGYKIFAIFDAQRFPDSLPISDRELQRRTGIKSVQTIVDARRRLKNAGLIDFDTRQGKITRYRLTINQTSSCQAVDKQLSSSCQAVGGSSYIHARVPYTPITKEEGAGAGERVNKELSEVWADEMHRTLGASERYELADLEEHHGYEAVKAAILKTRQSRCYPTFDDFKAILTGKPIARSTLKGGEKVAGRIIYEPVDTSWI